jgi:Domain of unknown function (DUF4439)
VIVDDGATSSDRSSSDRSSAGRSSSDRSSSGRSSAGRVTETEAEAWQAGLAAVHAGIYAYALIGAKTRGATRRRATDRLERLSRRRDLLAGRISAAGRRPVPPAAGYALPFDVRTDTALRALGGRVERALASADADLVAGTTTGYRLQAADWLAEDSVAAIAWGADDDAFPGLPERSTG